MHTQHFIDNGWQAGSTGETIPVVDPTGDVRSLPAGPPTTSGGRWPQRAAVGEALDGPWSLLSAAERGRLPMRLAGAVTANAEELAHLEARDTGKSLRPARVDAAALARYSSITPAPATSCMARPCPASTATPLTIREPHGVTGHVIPWNYPMQIRADGRGGAAAGNACVVKPAEDSAHRFSGSASCRRRRPPAGALNVVTGYGHEAGAALTAHPGIDHICSPGPSPGGWSPRPPRSGTAR